jgi:hypothetical protein
MTTSPASPVRVVWQQATTQKIHSAEKCGIGPRTRYWHFRLELTESELASRDLCRKCFGDHS